MSRREQLAANLETVRARVQDACREVGRHPDEVTVVVVTKFFPASDVRLLAELGVRDVGENRHQEAQEKAAQCADLELRWHFIGGLQSNKAAAVASYADVVQSVDRSRLLPGLAKGAEQRGSTLDCLVQVSLDRPGAEGGRSGASREAVLDLASEIELRPELRLRGLMAVAPLGEDPAAAFARLAEQRAELMAAHPEATWLSAGMSADLEQAVTAGATHVRVGSAILGERPVIK